MIHINANLDLNSISKIDTQIVNDLLRTLNEKKEPLYITFFARKEEFKPKAGQEDDFSFLEVILPYEEVLNTDDTVPLMLSHLAQNVKHLTWLDHAALKGKIKAVLEAQSTPEAKAKRLEQAAKWAADRQVQIDHIEEVLKQGSNFSVYHKEPED